MIFGANQGTLHEGFSGWLNIRLRTFESMPQQKPYTLARFSFASATGTKKPQWRWNCCFDFQEPGYFDMVGSHCSGVLVL